MDEVEIIGGTPVIEPVYETLLDHDLNGPVSDVTTRMIDVGCFDFWPSEERLTAVQPKDQALFRKEAAWISKIFIHVCNNAERYERAKLEVTIERFLISILVHRQNVYAIQMFQEELIFCNNRLLSTHELFTILELDREWFRFRTLQKLLSDSVKNTQLKELLLQKTSTVADLRVLLLSVIHDIGKYHKGKGASNLINKVVSQVLSNSELVPYGSRAAADDAQRLVKDLEALSVSNVNAEQLKKVLQTASKSETEVSAAIVDFVMVSPELLLSMLSKLERGLQISTDPVPSSNKTLDVFHQLYPTKRITKLEMRRVRDDLLSKVLMAEKNDLIRLNLSFSGLTGSASFIPALFHSIVSEALQGAPGLPVNIQVPAAVQTLLTQAAAYVPTMTSNLSVTSTMLTQVLNEVRPFKPRSWSREVVSYGIKVFTNSRDKRTQIIITIVAGAKIQTQKIINSENNLDNPLSSLEQSVDLSLEDDISALIKLYFPKVIVLEATTEYTIRMSQVIKELVKKYQEKSLDSLPNPLFITRKTEISEYRAFSLQNGLKEKTSSDPEFYKLMSYSLACYGQDPLIECLKVRFHSKEMPNFRQDLLKTLDPTVRLRVWDFILRQQLVMSRMPLPQLALLPFKLTSYVYGNHTSSKEVTEVINHVKSGNLSKYDVENFEKKVGSPFMFGPNELGLPSALLAMADDVKSCVQKLNKNSHYLIEFCDLLDNTVRTESTEILLKRKTGCPTTKLLFETLKLPLENSSFLKFVVVIRYTFGLGNPHWFYDGLAQNSATNYLLNWRDYLQKYRIVKLEIREVYPKFARGRIFSSLTGILSYQDIRLETNQAITPHAVLAALNPGQIVEAKIMDTMPDSCIVKLSINIQKEDAKRYLAENRVLLRYKLEEGNTFKFILAEDFPFTPLNKDEMKKRARVKFPRATNYPFFRNLDVFECRQELQVSQELDHLIRPLDAKRLELLWKVQSNIIAEEQITEIDSGNKTELELRGEVYENYDQVRREFIDRIKERITQVTKEKRYVEDYSLPNVYDKLTHELKNKLTVCCYLLSLSKEKPGMGILSTIPVSSLADLSAGKDVKNYIRQEYFAIKRDRFSFHDLDFFEITELTAWTRSQRAAQTYESYMLEHPEMLIRTEAAKPQPQNLPIDEDIGEITPEDAWFLGRKPTRGARGGGERGGRGGDRDFRGGRGGDRGGNYLGKRNFNERDRDSNGRGDGNDWTGNRERSDWRNKATSEGTSEGWGRNEGTDNNAGAWGTKKIDTISNDAPWSKNNNSSETAGWNKNAEKTISINDIKPQPAITQDNAGWGRIPTKIDEEIGGGWEKNISKASNENTSRQNATKQSSNNDEGRATSTIKMPEQNQGWGKPAAKTSEDNNKGWEKGPSTARDDNNNKTKSPTRIPGETNGWAKDATNRPGNNDDRTRANGNSSTGSNWKNSSPFPDRSNNSKNTSAPSETPSWGNSKKVEENDGWTKGPSESNKVNDSDRTQNKPIVKPQNDAEDWGKSKGSKQSVDRSEGWSKGEAAPVSRLGSNDIPNRLEADRSIGNWGKKPEKTNEADQNAGWSKPQTANLSQTSNWEKNTTNDNGSSSWGRSKIVEEKSQVTNPPVTNPAPVVQNEAVVPDQVTGPKRTYRRNRD